MLIPASPARIGGVAWCAFRSADNLDAIASPPSAAVALCLFPRLQGQTARPGLGCWRWEAGMSIWNLAPRQLGQLRGATSYWYQRPSFRLEGFEKDQTATPIELHHGGPRLLRLLISHAVAVRPVPLHPDPIETHPVEKKKRRRDAFASSMIQRPVQGAYTVVGTH